MDGRRLHALVTVGVRCPGCGDATADVTVDSAHLPDATAPEDLDDYGYDLLDLAHEQLVAHLRGLGWYVPELAELVGATDLDRLADEDDPPCCPRCRARTGAEVVSLAGRRRLQ